MAIAVDRIHQQFNKQENVVDFDSDFDFDDIEETKKLEKLSLNDVPPVPEKDGKPAGDFLYHNITKCLAPETFSPDLLFLNNQPEVVMIIDDKPKKSSPVPCTWSPLDPPSWANKRVFELPQTYEEYASLKTSQVPCYMAKFISDEVFQ